MGRKAATNGSKECEMAYRETRRKGADWAHLVVLATLILGSFAPAAPGQEGVRLEGQIVDQGGGRIPGADIFIRDAVGTERFIKSDAEGNFAFLGLARGRYTMRVMAARFATYQNEKVTVSSARRTPLTIMLHIAPGSDQITVTTSDDYGLDGISPLLVLRGDALDVLPDAPDALEATLRVLAGGP